MTTLERYSVAISLSLVVCALTPDDVAKAQGTVIGAMAIGDITPEEANVVAEVLEAKRRSIETCELEARMTVLEQMKK